MLAFGDTKAEAGGEEEELCCVAVQIEGVSRSAGVIRLLQEGALSGR